MRAGVVAITCTLRPARSFIVTLTMANGSAYNSSPGLSVRPFFIFYFNFFICYMEIYLSYVGPVILKPLFFCFALFYFSLSVILHNLFYSLLENVYPFNNSLINPIINKREIFKCCLNFNSQFF